MEGTDETYRWMGSRGREGGRPESSGSNLHVNVGNQKWGITERRQKAARQYGGDLADGDERRGSGEDEKKPKVTKGKKASGREGNWRRRKRGERGKNR